MTSALPPKSLLRAALTAPPLPRREALNALHTSPLPPSFLPLLLARLPSSPDHVCASLSTALLLRAARDPTSAPHLLKKLPALTTATRRAPPPTREALYLAKFAAALTAVDSAATPARDLLLVAIAAVEASPSASSGPARRAKAAALASAYRAARRAIRATDADPLLAAAEVALKAPAEGVAALGLLAPAFAKLDNDLQRRYVACVATLCVKCGSETATDVVRAARDALRQTDATLVLGSAMPVVERALLREPELALPAAAALLRGLRGVDLSPAARNALFPAVVQAVKGSDKRTRSSGIRLAEELSFCVRNGKERVEGVGALCAFLKTARYAHQKVAAVEAIGATVCAAAEEGERGEMELEEGMDALEAAVESVRTWLASKKEANEEVRAAGMQTLARAASVALRFTEGAREASSVVKACGVFFGDVLGRKYSDADRRALLKGLSAGSSQHWIPPSFVGGNVITALQDVIAKAAKTRDEECLRAYALLTWWSDKRGENLVGPRSMKLWKVLGDADASPVLMESSAYATVEEVRCVLQCCGWMVATKHEAAALALGVVFKLCLDDRSPVSSAALDQVRSLRRTEKGDLEGQLFTVLWESQFSGKAGGSSVARSYSFDDGMVRAEKLGQTLMATALPRVPAAILPSVVIAANHPRLSKTSLFEPALSRSRYWAAIERTLEPVEPDAFGNDNNDWLERSLQHTFTEFGLLSNDASCTTAAVNALGALADSRNPYSTRVLRRSVGLLRRLALGAPQLGDEAHEALRLVKEADALSSQQSAVGDKLSMTSRKSTKKQMGGSNARVNQQKQAEIDRARAAAVNASAIAEKANAARALAAEASKAFQLSREALRAIRVLAVSAPLGVHYLTAPMLSLVLPSAKLVALEDVCRGALLSVALTSSDRLRPYSVDIAATLYGLERQFDVQAMVSSLVYSLKNIIPPALAAEDFSLVSPVIRAALLKDPEVEHRRIMSEKRGSTKRRDAVAVVKAACLVLVEHCKPEAIDSAVAAAASRAGSWAVKVLEREDGAFAAAAEALALLAGSALTPGTDQLSQVLEGIISGKSSVRDAALAALARLPQLAVPTIECPRDSVLGRSLWLGRFDPDEANAELAEELWGNYDHPLFVPDDVPGMLGLLAHSEWDIRVMSAKAIAAALQGKEQEATRNTCISHMFTTYLKNLPRTNDTGDTSDVNRAAPPVIKRGRDRAKDEFEDEGWCAREGVALAIEHMAITNALKAKDITASFAFLAGRGLGDRHDQVRARMSKAATAVVQAAGSLGPSVLLMMIEKQLNAKLGPTASPDDVMHADRTRENLVMCLGSVAEFLPPEDPRVGKIAQQVMKTGIETPSDVVQLAAARCLVPLAKSSISQNREAEVANTLFETVHSDKSGYGERRGAAYALAGISRGLGLKYMQRFDVMSKIESALSDRSPRRRQGGFLLVETHALLMGRLFEPYTVAALPFLLSCMGDSAIEVRNACWSAAQAAMSEISSQGVKMILPSLLTGLQDRQWRTKAGSAEVLGAMAFCAPRQLAQCLPEVVPKLADALADAHPKVVNSAESAVSRIAAVVRSPEVRKLSPFLLSALRDPSGKTRGAIDAMLGSEFVHAIDAASLALLIPPLHRGLRDRSSELKKRSAAIVGSMCNNVANPYDVVPYLDLLLPSLRVTLLDAIPDVRRTSARALGALAVSLGEKGLPDVVPWLINALLGGVEKPHTPNGERAKIGSAVISSSAERSGAAMGLAEVAASMNDRRLEDVLNRVLLAGQSSPEGKEGSLMLIAAMPRALGERFEGRLAGALSATLLGLADDTDNVREAALAAGRSLVSAYAKTSLEHLLPEILSAMREKLWRIRMAATRLLGDMLLVIAGARPDRPEVFGVGNSAGNDEELKASSSESGEDEDGEKDDEDDGEGEDFDSPEQAAAAMTTEATMKAIEEVLGFDRRNDVLAALYIVRCDVSIRVRQVGMQVWKTVVSNTPRVLREIMPSAVRQIVDGLGDEDEERRAASGRTLGDLSQKLGDRVVPEVLPALRIGLSGGADSERIRKGACEGLGELVAASPRHQLEEHGKDLIDTVYVGLCDDSGAVRAIAAEVFSALLKPLETVAVDAVVPRLIGRLSIVDENDREDAELALDALKQILRASGSRLMSIVVPRLLKEKPLSASAARALATAALVGESAFEPFVADVTECIVDSVEDSGDTGSIEPLEEILGAISSCRGGLVKTVLDVVFSKFNEGYVQRRIAASRTCAALCRSSDADGILAVSEMLLEVLIRQLADLDICAAQAALDAVRDLCSAVPSRALMAFIPAMRQSLRSASTGISATGESLQIQGLQLPKAVGPFVPILTDGLLYGEAELREQAALAIEELVDLVDPKGLGPFVIKLTGPLIRVMSGRFPWQVRAAVLKALIMLLKKTPAMLRTFAPQLQSIFVKSLADRSGLVQKRACVALGALVPVQVRLEGLLNDLIALSRSGETPGSRIAAFHSCSQVFRFGKKLPESSFETVPGSIACGLSDDDANVSKAAGRSLGFLAGRANTCEQYEFVLDLVLERLNETESEYTERVAALEAIGAVYDAGIDVESLQYEHISRSVTALHKCFESAVPAIQRSACMTGAKLIRLFSEALRKEEPVDDHIRDVLLKIVGRAEFDLRPDVRVAALEALKSIILVDELVISECISGLVVCAAETNTGIRNAADRVLRKAFLDGRDLVLNQENITLAKSWLEDEDKRFLDRRIPKLRALTQSDGEED